MATSSATFQRGLAVPGPVPAALLPPVPGW
jgi:hypothetical protein